MPVEGTTVDAYCPTGGWLASGCLRRLEHMTPLRLKASGLWMLWAMFELNARDEVAADADLHR